jgi:hypothetical protein
MLLFLCSCIFTGIEARRMAKPVENAGKQHFAADETFIRRKRQLCRVPLATFVNLS